MILVMALCSPPVVAGASDVLIPPVEEIKDGRPRLLLRPDPTPFAISLNQLRSAPRTADYEHFLEQLRNQDHAAARAMVWLLTGDTSSADQAIERMRSYEEPEEYDTFHIHSRLTEFGLAYDWLCGYPGFDDETRQEIRRRVTPTAWQGYRNSNDHMFHNYVWMSAGGAAIWALATAGEDQESDRLFDALAQRFNTGLFPAMRYLAGLPSEPLGYWFYYDFHPCMLLILATQSAFEKDLASIISQTQEDWAKRHFLSIVHGVLPDLRFIPWGDLQGGTNGGVTIRAAGMIDAVTWLLDSSEGAWLSQQLAGKRGLERFHGWTPIFFMLYTQNLRVQPGVPSLSYLAGNHQAGHFIARSGWEDEATIVAFRSTDHYGDHNHHDQGSFLIYRQGLLAVDPPIYRKVRGPQEPTEVHNTLLLDGGGQRDCRGQSFPTIEIFEQNRTGGPTLETGDILFYTEKGSWAAVAGQFAQAYAPSLTASCVRQLLFLRPGTILILDHLTAHSGQTLPTVDWLLQVPQEPELNPASISAKNGTSFLELVPQQLDFRRNPPTIRPTQVDSYTISLEYNTDAKAEELRLVHLLEVRTQRSAAKPIGEMTSRQGTDYYDVTLGGRAFRFNLKPPYAIHRVGRWN